LKYFWLDHYLDSFFSKFDVLVQRFLNGLGKHKEHGLELKSIEQNIWDKINLATWR
jgi:hypothetical protein